MSAHKLPQAGRRPRILLIDNLSEHLDLYGRALQLSGYEVITADNLRQARSLLDEGWFHLAIIDLRMRSQIDDKDLSGLILARKGNPAIPKMILTAFPTWQDVRDALGIVSAERPSAVDFVSKGEGLKTFLAMVRKTLEKRARFNWALEIEWQPGDNYALVERLNPGLRGEALSDRQSELDDLLRAVFEQEELVRIERHLWDYGGLSAFSVLTRDRENSWRPYVIVCGRVEPMLEEERLHKKYAPQASGSMTTTLHGTKRTTHFAANLYSFAGPAPNQTHSLLELYRSDHARQLESAFDTLLRETLSAWSQEHPILEETKTLDEVYRECLGVTKDDFPPAMLEKRVKELARQIPSLSAKLERSGDDLVFNLEGQSYTYPDPSRFLYRTFAHGEAVAQLTTPRRLPFESVMTDNGHRAWLTYFGQAGLSPALWNYVELEATVRFDLVDTSQLRYLHQMELALISDSFNNLHPDLLAADIRKPVRTIQKIRQLAYDDKRPGMHLDELSYHVGMLFQTAHRLARINPESQLTLRELIRLAHLLLAAAVISRRLEQGKKGPRPLRLDPEGRGVWMGDEFVELTPLDYKILHVLSERPGQPCGYEELIKRVYVDEVLHPETKSSALTEEINRLRKKIEKNPKRPRYLKTKKGVGYYLVLEPKD